MKTLKNYGGLVFATRSAGCRQAAILAGVFALTAPLQASAQNGDYDRDCAAILCLAGGFPAGCYAAYDYMLHRLKRGKSPFGTCTGSKSKNYKDIDAPYTSLNRYSRSGWYCPKTTQLHHEVYEEDYGRRSVTAFCYRARVTGADDQGQNHVAYIGKRPATPVNYRIQITLEPGTAEEYRSPTYLLNSDTGFLVEQCK